MFKNSSTTITHFILLGFNGFQSSKVLIFSGFLVIYILVLTGNTLTIILVSITPSLHTSMYFFLCNLSLSDILYCSGIVPNLLYVVWAGGSSISLVACLTQFQIYGESVVVSAILLAVMAYDRYIAICKPLRYNSIMNLRLQCQLAFLSWLSGILITLDSTVRMSFLTFCGSNIIEYYFCDFYPLLDLACSDASVLEIHSKIFSFVLVFFPFIIICLTYLYIVFTILKMSTVSGRQKAFYTCSSHLSIVCLFYGSLTIIYVSSPKRYSFSMNKALSLLNTLGTPLLNPIIYSLRNAEIKLALWRLAPRSYLKLWGFLRCRTWQT